MSLRKSLKSASKSGQIKKMNALQLLCIIALLAIPSTILFPTIATPIESDAPMPVVITVENQVVRNTRTIVADARSKPRVCLSSHSQKLSFCVTKEDQVHPIHIQHKPNNA